MRILEALLVIIDLTDGKATRTVIQKLSYFLEVSNIIDVEFRPHYYGPYSDDVQEMLSSLVGLKFVEENAERYDIPSAQWRGKKYTYKIAGDGKIVLKMPENNPEYDKIREIIEKCQKISDLNLDILAAASKIHYVLKREKREMDKVQILEEAKKLGWDLNNQGIEKAADLLIGLNLARRSA